MYRQILLDPRDRDFQRILWRTVASSPVVDYQLNMVTFGMSCAPFLALRVLQQLREDEGLCFPLASDILCSGLYIDDCLFGGHNLDMVLQAGNELIFYLSRGCFNLRKWAGNEPILLEGIDPVDHGLAWDKPLQEDDVLKILGVSWNPIHDAFHFTINLLLPEKLTTRTVLSLIKRLYYPLGWVAPVLVSAKISIQRHWLANTEWDEPLSQDLVNDWTSIYEALPALNDVAISRWTGQEPGVTSCEIHSFSDASSSAYAAVVYIRVRRGAQSIQVTLLASRTNVAPLKQLTIPRLELSSAVLLAKLLSFIRQVPIFSNMSVRCWTDASIVLHWFNNHPVKWNTFVANRVAEIQTLLPGIQWSHVSSEENPADLASRGVSAHDLSKCKLWFEGPKWLSRSRNVWPRSLRGLPEGTPLEERVSHVSSHHSELLEHLTLTTSTWSRFSRIYYFGDNV